MLALSNVPIGGVCDPDSTPAKQASRTEKRRQMPTASSATMQGAKMAWPHGRGNRDVLQSLRQWNIGKKVPLSRYPIVFLTSSSRTSSVTTRLAQTRELHRLPLWSVLARYTDLLEHWTTTLICILKSCWGLMDFQGTPHLAAIRPISDMLLCHAGEW